MWLLPTKRRLELLNRFFVACRRTQISTPGIVMVQKAEYDELRAEYNAIKAPDNWHIEATEGDTLGDKLRECEPLYMHLPWAGLIVDDVIPKTIRFDEIILSVLKPGRVVSTNDGQVAPHRICCPVYSGELLRAVGWMFPPGFNHLFTDDVWETIGREASCWDVLMSVTIRHYGAFQTGEVDATHKASYSHWDHDKLAFENWCRDDKAACIERVKACLKQN